MGAAAGADVLAVSALATWLGGGAAAGAAAGALAGAGAEETALGEAVSAGGGAAEAV
jgi:hypothetical protein